MHQTVTAPVAAPPDQVAEIISDLATYPKWLKLVTGSQPEPATDEPSDAAAWLVTIRAKVGPFARSKKLRMVRTIHDQSSDERRFRFERRELDGRNHSAWTLDATVSPAADGSSPGSTASSTVSMDLRYEGALWTAPLEPILGSFIADAGPSLERYANRSATA